MASRPKMKPNGSTAISGIVTRFWDENNKLATPNVITASGGIRPVRTQHVELTTLAGRSILIQLHSFNYTYRIRQGDKLLVRIPNLIQIYQLPNLTEDILTSTSARVAGILFPERSTTTTTLTKESNDAAGSTTIPKPVFEIITKYNAAIPASIPERYEALRQGVRRQVTFKLLAERVELWPQGEHLMYLSAILTEVRLVELWKMGEFYCMPCEGCGEVVFGRQVVGICSRAGCREGVEMRINPQVLGGLADETGGLGRGHSILVADGVWEKLLGRSLVVESGRGGDGTGPDERWLKEREKMLLYERFTWVLMWMGKWGGGRLVLVDILE